MKTVTWFSHRLRLRAALLSLTVVALPVALRAQAAPAASAPAPAAPAKPAPTAEDVAQLDPFEVKTDKDNSYGALNSNSLTRFNTELDKTPVVADVFTKAFIDDTGSTTLEDLFGGYAGGAGMVLATPESDSTANPAMGDRFSVSQFGQRGLSAGAPRRDGFQFSPTQINATNLFDTERVEIVRGSQGLIYGAAGAGGTINLSSKNARFSRENGEASFRVDQFGSRRENLDFNQGWKWGAVRFDILQQNNQYYELFTGDVTQGYYGQAAFRLPFRSILRVSAEGTHNSRINTNNTSVNFGGTTVDPRSGYNIPYLTLTHQLGATNPVTGAAYPGGPIDNGHIDSRDMKSWAGWTDEETQDNTVQEITLDSSWTNWFSTSFGVFYGKSQEMRATNLGNLSAPLKNGNPLNDWAISSTFANSENPQRQKEYRAAALFTNDLFGGRAHSQTSIGFDRQYSDSSGGIAYNYYLADSSGNVPLDTTKTNLGRTAIPTSWWAVPNGPVEYPYFKVGAQKVVVNGQTYVRQVQNPRDPAWITPSNPLGLASVKFPSLGVSGGNNGGFANQTRNQGYYLANFTSWWHDDVTSFMGFRMSDAFTRSPLNSTTAGADAWKETRQSNFPSYNAGLDFRIPKVSWVRGYAAYSRTFNTSVGSNSPYGDVAKNPTGYTWEGGLKFTAMDGRISGSLSAFNAFSKNDNYNAGTTFRDAVNPNGLNGAFNAATKNQWAQFDKTSQGIEATFTAAPTSRWRMRFSFNAQEGKVLTTSEYPMLYNDEFYVKNGGVTYADGSAFLVPDPANSAAITALGKQTTAINPATSATYNANLIPLTVAMINDPGSPYFAYGWASGQTAANYNKANEPINGSIGQPIGGSLGTRYLFNALSQFRNAAGQTALTGRTGLPFSSLQYAFADPANLQGTYIVQKKGDKAVGFPAIRMNFANTYTLGKDSWLRDFSIGGSVALAWYNQSFYYTTPDRVRHLFAAPLNNPQLNTWLIYEHHFMRRYVWRSQLNINNLFNRYSFTANPNNGLGFTNPASLTATFYNTPRSYALTNTISF